MKSGIAAIRMNHAVVTTLSSVSPQRPSPPSAPLAATASGAKSASRTALEEEALEGSPHGGNVSRAADGRFVPLAHGRRARLRPREGHRGHAAAAGRLVQARAPRAAHAVGPQRHGQDDPAADAGGGERGRPRRARAREGHPGGAARPAPAARTRAQPARLRPDGLRRAARHRGPARRARGGDGRRRGRRRDARRLRRAPRRGSSTPAATAGARASTRPCAASACATTSSTNRSRRSRAAS